MPRMDAPLFRTSIDAAITASFVPKASGCPPELLEKYQDLVRRERLEWNDERRLIRLLGAGSQGMVFLAERVGADDFRLPVALKIFSPEPYADALSYTQDMARISHIAARVARIQHDNLLQVQNFISYEGFRVMVMEWIDGFDLGSLLDPARLDATRERVASERWDYLNDVVVTAGAEQSRLKPGVAMQIVRECLEGLTALHRSGILHGDLKPANIMLKRTGAARIIDIGSATDPKVGHQRRVFSPAYAAPEVLEGHERTPKADLASLGYVLIEALVGASPFAQCRNYAELMDAKRSLPGRLKSLLPEDVGRDRILQRFCERMIATDPNERFASAEAAGLHPGGAADFHRRLIKSDMASEFGNDIRLWLESMS